MVQLDGGTFLMGTDDAAGYPADGEGPVHEVNLTRFKIDTFAVTNERFAEFIAQTGYVTAAQTFEWSFVFAGLLPDDFEDTRVWPRRHGGVRCSARTGLTPKVRAPISTAAPTTPSSTCPGTTRRRTARGRKPVCRPKRSGSTRREAASSRRGSRGARSWNPAATIG